MTGARPGLALRPGRSWPLGASVVEGGVNWAVYSENATTVEVCLFDAEGRETRLPLPGRSGAIHHGLLPDAARQCPAGLRYGLRAHGPYDPARGHRFNPHKLLIDPLARQLDGPVRWSEALFGYNPRSDDGDLSFSATDSAPFVPKAVIPAQEMGAETADGPGRGGRRTTRRRSVAPLAAFDPARLVIYEAHVKGQTQTHARVPASRRGTFAGLASPAMVDHLTRLGVTAVELLPVWAFADEPHLWRLGLTNYWGYNPVCFGAPHPAYGDAEAFVRMVETLHKAGIAVLLDVVLNHTGEGDERGPTLSLRGLDNAAYYRLLPDDPRRYANDSACGNTVRFENPQVLRLAMDALRLWVQDRGVDGFRFDLAVTPARHRGPFDPGGPFLGAIAQDPVLSQALMIAEPWDMGPGGQVTGGFPTPWREWNNHARDGLRRFWLQGGGCGEMASVLAGSAAVFQPSGRGPEAGVTFVTAHDGFPLADLVSYAHKHNEANGENNRDGTTDNLSHNHGVEGPSADPVIRARRAAMQRALIASVLLALGTPMLLAGDEIGNTQQGNNNTYCQDNPLGWLDWAHADADLCAFVARAIALRHRLPQLSRTRFLTGVPADGGRVDVLWLRPDGVPLTPADWTRGPRAFAMRLNADPPAPGTEPDAPRPDAPRPDATEGAEGADLLLVLSAEPRPLVFALPPDRAWTLALASDPTLDATARRNTANEPNPPSPNCSPPASPNTSTTLALPGPGLAALIAPWTAATAPRG